MQSRNLPQVQKITRMTNSQPKYLTNLNLYNISSKFTGTGGNCSSLAKVKRKPKGKPKKTGIFQAKRRLPATLFMKHYERGDLPIAVDFSGAKRKVTWKVQKLELLDYHLYLPIFFEGLRENTEPYLFLADRGCDELLDAGKDTGKILPVLPQLILPIKKALGTKNHAIMCRTLKKLQKLVQSGEFIGEALVPYYRQILPMFNLFKRKTLNIGDKIDYGQRHNKRIGELIQDTLEILEKHGGEDAYINIKYMIPTYESCMF